MSEKGWPSVFVTGRVSDEDLQSAGPGSIEAKVKACELAMNAWVRCSFGECSPEKFNAGLDALTGWAELPSGSLQDIPVLETSEMVMSMLEAKAIDILLLAEVLAKAAKKTKEVIRG